MKTWYETLARATARMLILLVIIAIPAGIYVFVVVKKQEAAATAQNLRAVKDVGVQLDDRLGALMQIADRFPDKFQLGNSEKPSAACPKFDPKDPVAEDVLVFCDLVKWKDYFASQAAVSGANDELLLRVTEVLPNDMERVRNKVAEVLSERRYCGAMDSVDRLTRTLSGLARRPLNFTDLASVRIELVRGSIAECKQQAKPTQLIDVIRAAYELRDAEYRAFRAAAPGSTLAGVASLSLEVTRLDVAILEAALRKHGQDRGVSCVASVKDTLDNVGEAGLQPADFQAIWTALKNSACDESKVVATKSDIEQWADRAQEASQKAPLGSATERDYLRLAQLLSLFKDHAVVDTSDIMAAHERRTNAFEQYQGRQTPPEAVAALQFFLGEGGSALSTIGLCSSAPFCLRQINRLNADMNIVRKQLQTSAWFRSLTNLDTESARQACEEDKKQSAPASRGVHALLASTIRSPTVFALRCADAPAGADVKTSAQNVVLSVPLADLLPDRLGAPTLSGVILADCKGDVLYSNIGREFEVRNAVRLLREDAAPAAKEKEPNRSPAGTTTASECAGGPQSWVSPADIGGTPVRVFGHPYWPPSLERVKTTDTWYLVGIEPESEFSARTRVFPFEVTVTIVPLVVLAVLVWPLLLITLSGPGVRFGVGVPVSFVVTAVAGAAAAAILGLGLYYHYQNAELRDSLLERVATRLHDSFRDELARSLRLLTKGDHDVNNPLARADEPVNIAINRCARSMSPSDIPIVPPVRADFRCFPQYYETAGSDLVRASDDFEFAFQLDRGGAVVGPYLSLRDSGSGRQSLAARAYVQRTIRGLLFDAGAGPPFVLEQIRSKDFGWALTTLAVPITAANGSAAAGASVAVLLRRFQTFFSPVLPHGVGFALVRDTDGTPTVDGQSWRMGDVIFHSDDSRSLIENFLSDTGNDAALARVLTERVATPLSVSYRGAPYRIYTRPLAGVPWTLVVTYDKTILRLSALRLIASAGAAFLSYLLLMGSALWLIQRFWFKPDLPAWLTPGNEGSHLVAALGLLALVAVLYLGGSSWMAPYAWPSALWWLLIGNALAVFGILTSRFSVKDLGATGKPFSKTVVLEHAASAARRHKGGTAVFTVGWALVLVSTLTHFNLGSLLALLLLLVLFFAPLEKVPTVDSDAPHVLFIVVALLAFAALPASLLLRDANAFQHQWHDKANLAAVAAGAKQREEQLRGEASRLQPATFDRAAAARFTVPPEVWCQGVFGLGTNIIAPSCESPPTATSAPSTTADDCAEGETFGIWAATSPFLSLLPVEAEGVLVSGASNGGRTDDGSFKWRRKGSVLSVCVKTEAGVTYQFESGPRGLFDSSQRSASDKTEIRAFELGGAILGLAVLAYLVLKALRTVLVTFFGRRELRDLAPHAPTSGWAFCSDEEKIVLRHVARGGLVSCITNERAVRKLLARGLVAFRPTLTIPDPKLRDSVAMTEISQQELEHQKSRAGGSWSALRVPFFTLIAVAVIAISVYTPNTLSMAMGILAASAGGIGVIVQIMGLVRKT